MRTAALALALVGCGRVSFDPRSAPDAREDARVLSPPRVLIIGSDVRSVTAFHDWLSAMSTSVDQVADDAGPIDSTLLAGHDLVILEGLNGSHTISEATALHDWVAAGGGLAVLLGYVNTPMQITIDTSLVGPFGITLLDSSLMGPVTSFTSHPTTAGVVSLPFLGGDSLDPAGSGTALVIANLGGQPVACVDTVGAGRILMWGDEWVSDDLYWNADTQTFWTQVVAWLRG